MSARRKQLRSLGLEMEHGLRGITISWAEVGTALSATTAALAACPSGSFPSQYLTRLHARLKKRKELNSIAIEKEERRHEP